MTLSLADEIRANTAAIVAQLRGFSKQPPHLQKVTLPAPFFSQIADKIEELDAEARAPKPCSECGTHSNLFDVVEHLSLPSRSNPLAAAFATNATKGCL